MPSPDEIKDLALDMIGETRDSNLLDDSSDGRKLKRGYDTSLASMLGGYNWKFATKFQDLAALAEAPAGDMWSYQYELPSDCLQPRRLNEDDRAEWERVGDNILTNEPSPILLEYTKLVTDPGLWPGTFVTAFITLLASVYAGTFKNDYAAVKEMRSLYYQNDLPEAKTQDAKARSIVQIRVPTLTDDVRSF
jgi:hypothetical protein